MFEFLKNSSERLKESRPLRSGKIDAQREVSLEKSVWKKIQLGFAQYLTKNLLNGGQLEYAKPLSMRTNKQTEIEENKQKTKMLSKDDGGPTKEEIYTAALKVAQKFGWEGERAEPAERVFYMNEGQTVQTKEETAPPAEDQNMEAIDSLESGIPLFITNRLRRDLKSFGVTEEEIGKLKPKEAWNLLQQKTLEKKMKEPKEEKVYTIKEIDEEAGILLRMRDEACEAMENVSSSVRTNEILDLTAHNDAVFLKEYLQKNIEIQPEEKYFIEMSIMIKEYASKVHQLLYEGVEKVNE
jgi:hypothetical protein